MLNAFASLKCLKKCLHNVQKPTCHEGDKRFLFVAIPTFDIGSVKERSGEGSLTALLTIFVCFHGLILSGHYIMFSFVKQYQKISKISRGVGRGRYGFFCLELHIVSSYGSLISEECCNLN